MHRRRSREGLQVRTLTIIWLWGSSMAWTLTIIWLTWRNAVFDVSNGASWMPPAAFLHPENAPKSLAAGASPQTPLRELTAPPDPVAGLRGLLLRWGKEKGGGRGGTLDPHNVGDRFTPLPKYRGITTEVHNAVTAFHFSKYICRLRRFIRFIADYNHLAICVPLRFCVFIIWCT